MPKSKKSKPGPGEHGGPAVENLRVQPGAAIYEVRAADDTELPPIKVNPGDYERKGTVYLAGRPVTPGAPTGKKEQS